MLPEVYAHHSLPTRRLATAALTLSFLVACGAGQQAAAGDRSAGAAPGAGTGGKRVGGSAGATAAPAATAGGSARLTPEAAGARAAAEPMVFRVQTGESKATFRVREQLARLDLPSDAVGTTDQVSGQLALRPDGAVDAAGSKITVDLRTLATDSAQRDNFIKRNTLQTDQYPLAEFVPAAVEGLPNPPPASGELQFTLKGPLTIHGVQKAVAWDATATRRGDTLTGRATTAATFEDFGMRPPKVPVVLSVVDEIRLEIALVAKLAS